MARGGSGVVVQSVRSMEERVNECLRALVEEPCWSAIAGSTTDYAFVLHFGEKQRRSLRLANPHLSFLQRTYEGTYSLLIQCVWRVDAPGGVVASCWDERDQRMAALDRFVDRTVSSVQAITPGYDLTLVFDDGTALRTLSVENDLQRGRDDWNLHGPDTHVRVGPGARPQVRTAAEARAAFQRIRLALLEETEPSEQAPSWPDRPQGEADPPKAPSEGPKPDPDDRPPKPRPLRPVEGPHD